MKKIIIMIAIVSIALSANAQVFIGGNLGVEFGKNKLKHTGLLANTTEGIFAIAPKVGYFFNDKFAIGLEFMVGYGFQVSALENDSKVKQNAFLWGVNPFVRYSVFTHHKFALVLEGSIGLGAINSSIKYGSEKPHKNPSVLTVNAFNIAPYLTFNLTDHLILETGLHFLDFGYRIDIEKDKDADITETSHKFGLNFDTSNVLTLARVKMGVLFKF
jgi:hypothetical protein